MPAPCAKRNALSKLLRCAALFSILLLAGASRAADQAQLDQAAQVTADVCKALVRGDSQPLLDLAQKGDLREKLGEAIKSSPRAIHQDRSVMMLERDVVLKWTCNILAQDFAVASFTVLPAREGKEGPNVTARIERGRQKDYVLFRYRTSDAGLTLSSLDFPLLGADFVLLALQQTPYGRVLPNEPRPKAIAPWRKHLASILRWGVVLLLFGYLLFRRNKAAKETQPFTLRAAFLVPLGLLILFVMLVGWLYQNQRPVKPSEDSGQQMSMAAKLLGGGNFPDVERRAREALKLSPENLTARLALVNALMAQHKFADAKPMLQTLIDRDEEALFAHRELAIIATQSNDYAEAVRHLNALLDGLGEDEATLLDLAGMELSAGNSAEAEKALGRALAVNPTSFGALEMRARILIRRNNFDDAANDLRAIRKAYPASADYLSKDPEFSKLKSMGKYADLFSPSPAGK